jgi:hypothetical protein
MNVYKNKLQAELDALIRHRVALRRGLDQIARGQRVGDGHNTSRTIDDMRRQLQVTEHDYARLCTELGQEHRLNGPVSLQLTPSERAALARQASRPKATPPRVEDRGRTVPAYMTKVMRSG